MGKVLGIDLGTTNSVVAFLGVRGPEIVPTPEGSRIMPSVVALTANGDFLVGQPAKSQMLTNPFNTVFSAKRLIGRKFSEVEAVLHEFPYQIVRHEEDYLRIKLNGELYAPEEISAMVLARLKDMAEKHINEPIDGAIITVPAYFNDSQRQATKDAGTIAGLNVLHIINEPTSASLAFSLDLHKEGRVVVYDFGGGTIDISVLEISRGLVKVLATAGNTDLGGNNFDIRLCDKLIKEFRDAHQIDLQQDRAVVQRLREACEAAKIELSQAEETQINLPFITQSADGPLHLVRKLLRSEFESLIKKDVESTLEICERTLHGIELSPLEIDEVLLVGGTTRIPLVQKKVKEFFNREPNRRVNPDEIVAIGAAIEGGMLAGSAKDIMLLDVTPLSLGVKTFGGGFTRVINANTTIPVNRSLVFSTVEDNQSEVEINIFQGEDAIAEKNKFLGKFTLVDIKPMPRGTPRIEVTFSINLNGILTVSAIDLSTKIRKEVVVTKSGLLRQEDVAKLRKDMTRFKENDFHSRVSAEKRNAVYAVLNAVKSLMENRPIPVELYEECQKSLPEFEKQLPEAALAELTTAEEKLEALRTRLQQALGAQTKSQDQN